MDILAKLFSSEALVKIMRLFILNPDQGFENKDISKRSKIKLISLPVEINLLKSIGFIKKKNFFKEEEKKSRAKKRKKTPPIIVKKKVSGWFLNSDFKYLAPLKLLLVGADLVSKDNIVNQFRNAGKIKLLLISGIFVNYLNSQLDLLIVGDQLKQGIIDSTIKTIESEIGKELAYAVFDTPTFLYRLEMGDKLICNTLDFPHKRIIDVLEFSR